MNHKRSKPPDDVIVHAIRSINGEITNNMRMIAFSYDGKNATFKFYVANEPSEEDLENAEVAAVNFEAGHVPNLQELNIEFEVTNKALGYLDPLDFSLFRRSENLK